MTFNRPEHTPDDSPRERKSWSSGWSLHLHIRKPKWPALAVVVASHTILFPLSILRCSRIDQRWRFKWKVPLVLFTKSAIETIPKCALATFSLVASASSAVEIPVTPQWIATSNRAQATILHHLHPLDRTPIQFHSSISCPSTPKGSIHARSKCTISQVKYSADHCSDMRKSIMITVCGADHV